MYWVLPSRLVDGVKVTVFPLTFTVPAKFAPPAVGRRVKVAVLSVELFISSENVTETGLFNATFVVLRAGASSETVGGVLSGAAPVVKNQVYTLPIGLPAASLAAVEMRARYRVLPASSVAGVKVATFPLTSTVPLIHAPLGIRRVKLAVFSVELSIGSENVAETEALIFMPVSSLLGEVAVTRGAVVSGAAPVVNCQS